MVKQKHKFFLTTIKMPKRKDPIVEEEDQPAVPQPKRATQEEQTPYAWNEPKQYTASEFGGIAESLGGTTAPTLEGLSVTVDPLNKRATLRCGGKEGFDNVLGVASLEASVYVPSALGQYPNLDQIRGVLSVSEDAVSDMKRAVAKAVAANAGDFIKILPNGPDKLAFKTDPKKWVRAAIDGGQFLLPSKSTDVYNEDGTIERKRTEFAFKTRIIANARQVLSDQEKQSQIERARLLFGEEVAEHLRTKHGEGKTLRLPQIVDAMGAEITPEEAFVNGNFRFSGMIHGAFASLFLMEQKSKTHGHFSSITTINRITVVRKHASSSKGQEAMTDSQKIKLGQLL